MKAPTPPLIGNRIEGNTANNGGGVYVQGSAPFFDRESAANNQGANPAAA
ncbi:hypothetical protein [Candidatus Amarolinea dominans]|nr:hypothetical protein [Anaerolineae bacterium]